MTLLLSGFYALFLFELDQDLIEFHRFTGPYFHRFHFACNGRRNAGFHLHGFQNHQEIVQLQRFSGMNADSRYNSCHRTAAHSRFIGIHF
jgi:hypothetical protein